MKTGKDLFLGLTVILSLIHLSSTVANTAPATRESGGGAKQNTYGRHHRFYPPYPHHPRPKPPIHPPPPPPLSCDICEDVSSGFEDTLKYLRQIDEKVDKAMCPAGVTFVSGPPTTTPRGIVRAPCPEDTVPIDCRCSVDNATCVGSFIFGGVCAVGSTSAIVGQLQALATCVPTCSGEYTLEIVDGGPLPTATCPEGTMIIGCFKGDNFQTPPADISLSTLIDLDSRSCKPANPCMSACGVTAVCKAIEPASSSRRVKTNSGRSVISRVWKIRI